MPEDQGTNDANIGAGPRKDAAVPPPSTPAALTDEALNKVAGGFIYRGGETNTPLFKAPTGNTFKLP